MHIGAVAASLWLTFKPSINIAPIAVVLLYQPTYVVIIWINMVKSVFEAYCSIFEVHYYLINIQVL